MMSADLFLTFTWPLLQLAPVFALILFAIFKFREQKHRHKVDTMRAKKPIEFPQGATHVNLNLSRSYRYPNLPYSQPPVIDVEKPTSPPIASVALAEVLRTFTPSIEQVYLGNSHSGPVYRSLEKLMHVGVLGSSGSGKSTAQLALATQLAMIPDARLAVLDPQAKTFAALRNSPKLIMPLPMGDRDCVDTFETLQDILAERESKIKGKAWDWLEYNAQGGDIHPLFIFCDEVPKLIGIDGAIDWLMDLARRGRAYGMYLQLASQGFRAQDVGDTGIRQQVATKFVLRCSDEGQVRSIGAISKEHIQQALNFRDKGMAIYRPDDEEPQIIRFPYIDPASAAHILGADRRMPALPMDQSAIVLDMQKSAVESHRNDRNVSQDTPESPDLAEARTLTGISEREYIEIMALLKADVSRSHIHKQVLGGSGNEYWKIKAVADAAKLDNPAERLHGGGRGRKN